MFCVYYALFIDTPESFTLELVPPGSNRSETRSVPAVRAATLWSNFRERHVETDDPLMARAKPITLRFTEEGVVVLSVTAFHPWRWSREKLDYEAEIERIFAELQQRNCQTLALDLRGNEGGNMEIAVA